MSSRTHDKRAGVARILCVDDERNVLRGLTINLRRRFEVLSATSGSAGLDILRKEPGVAVVVSDMKMPGMNGAEFLARARESHPDVVRILLTGQADLSSAMRAVNDGQIFRFLCKPTAPEVLMRTLEAAVRQHQLIVAERDLLEKTLRGSLAVLAEVLSLSAPEIYGQSARIKRIVRHVGTALQFPALWRLDVAAMLYRIGSVTVPDEVLTRARHRHETAADTHLLRDVPRVSAELLRRIPRLETVAAIVARQFEVPDAKAFDQAQRSGDQVTVGAQILSAACEIDRRMQVGESRDQALQTMAFEGHHPRIIEALRTLELDSTTRMRELPIAHLRAGMVLAEAVVTASTGAQVVPTGHEITGAVKQRLVRYHAHKPLREPVKVIVSDG